MPSTYIPRLHLTRFLLPIVRHWRGWGSPEEEAAKLEEASGPARRLRNPGNLKPTSKTNLKQRGDAYRLKKPGQIAWAQSGTVSASRYCDRTHRPKGSPSSRSGCRARKGPTRPLWQVQAVLSAPARISDPEIDGTDVLPRGTGEVLDVAGRCEGSAGDARSARKSRARGAKDAPRESSCAIKAQGRQKCR